MPETELNDLERLRHMIEASENSLAFIDGRSFEDLLQDKLLQYAVSYAVQIIGEAANHITVEFQTKYPHVPWRDITGMRNRIVHAYTSINFMVLWGTVTKAIPPLLEDLRIIQAAEDQLNG